MCTRPIEIDGNTFACRNCDACIATRRAGWVARAMAEKAMHPYALSLTLTYDDSTPENRDAAAMFCYADVQAFLKRLRRAAQYLQPGAYIRFICAGEQGDRNGRCHWHLVLFSNVDLTSLGKFRRRGHFVSHKRDLLSDGKRKRRLNWSLWGHGFVTVQEADESAMQYVLSYCLKDQFTVQKSTGTGREAKAENFATGLFRMSKRPAIGEAWLVKKMERLDAQGAVLPSLNLSVPGLSGYWQPNGGFRKKLLWYLVALKTRVLWAMGRVPPQWPALLASCQDNSADLEVLLGKEEKPDFAEVARKVDRRLENLANYREERRKYTGPCCCPACLDGYDAESLAQVGAVRVPVPGGAEYRLASGSFALEPFPVWKACRYEPQGPFG